MSSADLTINELHAQAINSPQPIVLMFGGSGSGKTYAVSQWLLGQLLTADHFWGMYCRRNMTSLARSAWIKFLKMADDCNVLSYLKVNKVEHSITYRNNRLQFTQLDDEDKIKDFELDAVFIDELNQISEDVFMQVLNRLGRAKGRSRKIICASNPVSATHWIITKLWSNPTFIETYHAIKSHSTYKDNEANLDPDYIELLESYKYTHPRMHQVYCLGEPGLCEGLVYTNFEPIKSALDTSVTNYDAFGIDFGLRNPTAIVGVKKDKDGVQVDELLYRSELTTTDLIDYLKSDRIFKGKPIYCDSAEPDRIEELRRAGYNALKANKSRDAGIQFVAGTHLRISASSENLIKEIENYSYRKDREGNWLNDPVKVCDHCMDAMRYAIYTKYGKRPAPVRPVMITTNTYAMPYEYGDTYL